MGGIITDHGVHYHQYADDTQLHLAMRATTQLQDSLFLPRVPLTSDSGTLQNGLQLNPDKSEALVVGIAHQLYVVDSSVSSVSVADVDLPVAEDMKVFGVVLDRRLTFQRHVSKIGRAHV